MALGSFMATFQPQLSMIFGALADPTRLAVVEQLVSGPASVSELAQPFQMAGPSFLKHLRVLEDAGVIESEKRGRVRTVRLAPDALAWVETWVKQHRQMWERRLDDLGTFLNEENEK
jgi:DNA-binding transcriptional ArsR family regulator